MLKTILFLPPYKGPVLGPPLSLLAVAAAVREAGFDVKIIDGALRPDYWQLIEKELDDCFAFGVSLLTGPMIRDAMAVSRRVKRLRPDLPVIFGGWHPSLLPAQTLREDFVDVVVRHQGEHTMQEILQRLAAGRGLDLVAGCWFKRDGNIHQNPDRPTSPISKLPTPAYDLVDFDAYEKAGGARTLPYATSVGCPYDCHYCTDAVFYNRRFNAYDANRVAGEVAGLVARYRLKKVALVDSNFLVNTRRAADIARGFIASGQRFEWTFQASTDLLCRMSDDEVALLAESGVTHIGFGTESGSEAVLEAMNKPHQRIPDLAETARKCRQAGIRVTFNLIFGYPGERDEHRRETLRVMSEIGEHFDNVSFSPNIFTPYPGIPIWPQLREMGVHEPQSLAEWADIDLGGNVLPWMRGAPYRSVKRGIAYFLLANEVNKAVRRKARAPVGRMFLRWSRKPLYWRLKHHFFRWPVELWLSVVRKWLVTRRSLLTGRALGYG